MPEAKEKNMIDLSYSFIDEAFDISNASAYELILQVGPAGISVAVNEKAKNKFIALEVFNFHNIYSFDEVVTRWDLLVQKSKLITNNYKSAICLIVNNSSTLVPDPLFEEGSERTYLKFNVPVQWNEYVQVDDLKSIDAKNIFAFPVELKAKLDGLSGAINYRHYSTVLIDSLIAQNKNKTGKKLYVHIQQTHFEVILIDGKKLLFYNTFNHQSPEDFIYYLLFVCEQLHLNPENIEVVVVGETEKNSDLITRVQKYIRTIKFGERYSSAGLGYQLQTLPNYFYYTLFNNCVSLI
jgi:hypothetical protein